MSHFSYFLVPAITLLEGILYLGLSIWGLAMTACSQATSDIANKPFQFAMDLIYLQDLDCGNPNVTVSGYADPVTLNIHGSDSESIKTRTFVFLILYVVFSALWIIFSLLMIAISFRKTNRFIVILWFKFIWVMSIIDVVATGFHGNDIVYTSSASATFDYLGISTDAGTMSYLTSLDVYFTTPAIVMTAISSRAAILWLFNVIGSLYCLAILRKNHPKPITPTTLTLVVEPSGAAALQGEVYVKS